MAAGISGTAQQRLVTILVLVGSGLSLARVHSRFVLDTDDAYITYRYARNIAAGQGFVYNPGEKVLGTTTPLYTLLLSAAARSGFEIPKASAILNILFGASTVTLVFVWLSRLSQRISVGLAGAVLLFVLSRFLLFTTSGMETALYLFLIVATFLLYDRGCLVWAAVTAALAVLARMDGAAVAAALFGHFLITRRRLPPLRVFLAYSVVTLPWFAFSMWYFGDIRPQSMLAKHHHLMQASRWWMLEFLLSYPVLALWPLMAVGIWDAARREPAAQGLLGLALWAAGYVAAYSIFRIDLYLWYLTPLLPVVAVLSIHGLSRLLVSAGENRPTSIFGIPATVLVLFAAIGPYLVVRGAEARHEYHAGAKWAQTVEQSRADAAEYILRERKPGDVICTGAIGIVGWNTRMYICDVMGLVTRGTVGRPVREILDRCQARWYISEIEGVQGIPSVEGFRIVGSFNRGQPMTFLLYERADGKIAQTQPGEKTPGGSFAATNGLRLKCLSLDASGLNLELVTSSRQTRDYKFFVHVYPLGGLDGAPSQVCDVYPLTATSQMSSGVVYESLAIFKQKLPPAGAWIKVGLFDETDPQFKRLVDADQHDSLLVKYSPAAATEPH